MWSEKVRCSSNMKPRFRAEWVVVSEELLILGYNIFVVIICFFCASSLGTAFNAGLLAYICDCVAYCHYSNFCSGLR